jgi:hypothetical protein
MLHYHGTNRASAQQIVNNQIDVTLGRGELGQGFYTGDLKHEAFTWAHQIHGIIEKTVVEFDIDDDQFLQLNTLVLDYGRALFFRRIIRNAGATRTYLFNYDTVWSPVVGRYIPDFQQIKWENANGENFINNNVAKNIL